MKMGRWAARGRMWAGRGLWGLCGLVLFLMALSLMRTGAAAGVPAGATVGPAPSPARALAWGWLMAGLALSGSPVAAAAVSLQDAGVLSPAAALAMLTGSRLGASWGLFLIGGIYALRRGSPQNSMAAGLVTFWVTATMAVPALALGLWLLRLGLPGPLRGPIPAFPAGVALLRPLTVGLAEGVRASLRALWGGPPPEGVVGGILFVLGFGLAALALGALDRAAPLPPAGAGAADPPEGSPWPMFGLGLLLTAMTMSVSASVGWLVPPVARGWVHRERLIPYVMGANITTFLETLLAALLLGNPAAVRVVLVQILSLALVALGVLGFGYRPYRGLLRWLFARTAGRPLAWGLFLLAFLALPLALLTLPGV